MLTEIETGILRAAQKRYTLSDPYADIGASPQNEAYLTACALRSRGLVSMDGRWFVRIEQAGIAALLSAEQEAQCIAKQEANRKAEQDKADRLIVKEARRSWLQLFVAAFLGWLLSAIGTPGDVFRVFARLFSP